MKQGGRRAGMRCLMSGLALCLLAAACASPGERGLQAAANLGLEHRTVIGGGFSLALFSNRGSASAEPLHIYIEGDGTPWLGGLPALDPTPRDPLAMRLMARDANAAILLGRPCYHAAQPQGSCEPSWWTDRRYSAVVVDSMADALSLLLPAGRPVTLIGYSGGGVLAVLLAERLAAVDSVVTVAANLDIDAWTDLHRYERLAGSLNPALRSSLPARIRQVHLAGALDANVPPFVVQGFATRQSDSKVRVFEGFDHVCCWLEAWPGILDSIGRRS